MLHFIAWVAIFAVTYAIVRTIIGVIYRRCHRGKNIH